MGVWDRYHDWNDAIASCVYPELDHPAPVYLDLESEQVQELALLLDVDPEQVEQDLAASVRATLGLRGGPQQVFARHTLELRRWRMARQQEDDRSTPPPVLALLALLSMTAESMRHGDGMSDANYYGRLAQILGEDENKDKIAAGYRRVAERYWKALNDWLTGQDGHRGLPTAYGLQHRFVGLPLSQALVRKGDRDRLIGFFQSFGLSPGSQVPPDEIESLLHAWMSRRPSPATKTFERMWKRASARSRIAQTAAVALAAWDGTLPTSQGGEGEASSRAALMLELGTFPKRRFKLGILVHAARPLEARTARILSSAEDAVAVTLHPVGSGALSLGDEMQLDTSSLLEGVFELNDSLTNTKVTRRPKRVVAFKQDPLSQRWVEIEQVLLADEIRIVAHGDLVPRLEQVLERVARPGWTRVSDDFPGIPDGWAVYQDVEVLGHPGDLVRKDGFDDLSCLLPLTSRQVRIHGGFQLPGSATKKWHVSAPPEIRAVSDSPDGVSLQVVQFHDDEDGESVEHVVLNCEDPSGILVIGLEEEELGLGSYRVDLLESGKTASSTHFQLSSGDAPDITNWSRISPVPVELGTKLGVLGVLGSPPALAPMSAEGSCPEPTWWERTSKSRAGTAATTVALPDPASCIYTGRHVEVIESGVDKQGRKIRSTVTGRCQGCGLVRKYSNNYYRNRSRHARRKAEDTSVPASRDLSAVTPIRSPQEKHDWELLLDSLFHVGGGPWSSFERIAMQIEPTGIFVDHTARLLEALGHINIARDPDTLKPAVWEVTETRLNCSPGGVLQYVGYWPDSLSNATFSRVESIGGTVEAAANTNGPATWLSTLPSGAYKDPFGVPVIDVAREILEGVAPLSEVTGALPRRQADMRAGSVARFDPLSASWVDAPGMDGIGGYRVRRFGTLDLVRTVADLAQDQVAISTVQLSKHIAAQLTGAPALLAYSEKTKELRVPKGADLPGLLGRAAVSFSGREPVVSGRSLVYADVPRWAADKIHMILSS